MRAPQETAPGDNNQTVERILGGAMQALARRGSRKLSMTEIGEAAGVSRGTLYRYFKNKDEVLESIGQHVQSDFERRIAHAVAENPDVGERPRVVVEAMVRTITDSPGAKEVTRLQPAFALEFLRRNFDWYVSVLTEALTPALEKSPLVAAGRLTSEQVAELLARVVISVNLLPPANEDYEAAGDQIAALWEAALDV